MSTEFDEEYICFRALTPEEILQTKNQQTILTPQEKFGQIQKRADKRSRRLRKFHFVAIATTSLVYVFDGEGNEVIRVENSVKGCRIARDICLQIFLASPNQNGGYTFSGPNYENLTEEEIEQSILSTHKNIEFRRFSQKEIDAGEYEAERKNFCFDCQTQFVDRVKIVEHVCTEFWIVKEFKIIRRGE